MVVDGRIVEILGPGVTEGALRKAQQIDNYSGIEGYYESLLAEIAYRRGNKAEVLQHAAEAQRLLPSITRMTKARMMALEGWALGKQGDWDGAVQLCRDDGDCPQYLSSVGDALQNSLPKHRWSVGSSRDSPSSFPSLC